MSAGVIAAAYVDNSLTGPVRTLTIPAGTIASSLTSFVTRVNLAHLPSSWWTTTSSDLGNVRVKQAGTVIPFDIVSYDRTAQTGELFFKASLTTGANVFTIETVSGATALAVTDANGRNAVWSDYDAMFAFSGGLSNRTGTGTASIVGQRFDWKPLAPISPPSMPSSTNEGVAVDDAGNIYVISAGSIRKYDSTGTTLLATRSSATTATGIAGVNHLGDGQVYGGELFIPCETYPNSPYNNQHITVWNLSDLSFNRSYNISANAHEISGIAYNTGDGYWYATDFTASGTTVVHKYDTSWAHIGTVSITSTPSKQGIICTANDQFLMTTTAGIWKVTLAAGAMTATQVSNLQYGGSGANEGLAIGPNGRLYLVPEQATVLYAYEPQAISGMLCVSGSGYAKVSSLPKRTAWTMGVTHVRAILGSGNRGVLSYDDVGNANANRASIVERTLTFRRMSIWNSTDGFADSPGTVTHDGVRHRANHTQNTTVDRKLWEDGALTATDTGTAQRPAGTGDTLYMGVEDSDNLEPFYGAVDLVYLRNGVLSADWLAAEYASWETPSSFYAIT